ncbi:flagellar hook-length control protein FliK [Burkholderia cenocepacia]|uniref:flagellar hook-length control protein FliK n=1 Tax=Burkholderia cepacia complex TaxID=87882 RepID=UPI000F56F584|nr:MULTISPECIES: flagellar hook-length control protein FliK [Burkholderia cepacia complex]ELW9451294.1 flagellar hook-length control protein FliK [Burkholderia cenocepacia]MBR8487295.1 flagellar hook-length control protein FliK [Burkholderia cenocepacia]MDN7468101.1 flagellar hook-length control protein FliK [Burkholderia orbicola]MDN7505093.1 flagellar hook-length control protein FliK [Burkholderia orbicola]RQU21234.1 flagellar hook-length control protein FliK [Burkholderia cenocepacia]
MPPLPLLGALLDTAGAALKAARGSGASAANDASAATSAVPFAQTLKQSVATRGDTANAGTSDVSTKPAASKPTAGTKPSGTDDDKATEDTTANAATNPDAAALAAAAAVQAQLQARPDPATPADAATAAAAVATQKTAVSGQPDAMATLADHAAKDATAQPTDPASSRDALQAALAKLTGGAGAITMPATGTSAAATPTAPAATASNTAAPLTPKVPTFDRTLADAKGALATQQTPTQVTPQTLQADANAQSGAQHALAAAGNATDPAASATLAAGATAAAAAQANLQLSPAAGAIAAANAHVLAPHVGTADWTDALSQKVVFLSNAHQQSAELTLNPPDLGPLQVVLRVADNHAHALFVSQHAQVRDAVEAALPKLREAMEAGGLGLGSATVSDGGLASQQQQQNPQQTNAHGQPSRRGNGGPSAVDAPVDAAQSAPVAARASRAGLVDTFA